MVFIYKFYKFINNILHWLLYTEHLYITVSKGYSHPMCIHVGALISWKNMEAEPMFDLNQS